MKKIFLFLASISVSVANAKENVNVHLRAKTAQQKLLSNCTPTTAQADLDIANVRTTIQVGGDMWWDFNDPKYEVPKNSGKHSIFAGSVWVGGYDGNGNLKAAAQTYRQNSVNDYWGGPASNLAGVVDIDAARCTQFDRLWKVTRAEVQTFINTGTSTNDILTWPGNGNIANGELQNLAPYVDLNGNNVFDSGTDYPKYNFSPTLPSGTFCYEYLQGDQSLWWVFNDVGNVKTETTSQPIGLEVRAQAYAFSTGTSIDNCTFYQYQIINRSNIGLDSTYFGVWTDPDVGDYLDDYVGCDIDRGIGFCYNGDLDDGTGTAAGYGTNPPAIGVDFLHGPFADPNDGIDNDRDGTTDEIDEDIIMSDFLKYDNINNAATGNPTDLDDYYQYLSGSWCDGSRWTYGGSGFNPGSTNYVNFIFPGTTDPNNPGNWDEVTAGNVPGDRRFLQSAGSFTMMPGAVNYITTSVIWARGNNGPQSSVSAMLALNDTVQNFFNSCFNTIAIGIIDESKDVKHSVYPNPFNLQTVIKLEDEIKTELILVIFDNKGKIVEEVKSDNSQFVIKRKNKTDGIYLYQIKNNRKVIASGKLVISR